MLLFDLALACGFCHPSKLTEVLTRDQYHELLAYATIKPIGPNQLTEEFAFLRYITAIVQAGKKGARKIKIDDMRIKPAKAENSEDMYIDGTLFSKLGAKKSKS